MRSEKKLAVRVVAVALVVTTAILTGCHDFEGEENGTFAAALASNKHLEIPTVMKILWGVNEWTGTMPFGGVGEVGCNGHDTRDVWLIQHGTAGEVDPPPGRKLTIEPMPPMKHGVHEWDLASWDRLGNAELRVRLATCTADCHLAESYHPAAELVVDRTNREKQFIGNLNIGPGAWYLVDVEVTGTECAAPYYFEAWPLF